VIITAAVGVVALNALVDQGDEVLVPVPTYPLYTAVLAKIAAQPRYYRTDPQRDFLPDVDHLRSLVTSRARVLVIIDPNNPTGAVYPPATRRALIEFAEKHDLTILADEVYGDLGFEGSLPLLAVDLARPSFPSRVFQRLIWRQGGGPGGSLWVRHRGSTTRWRRSRSSLTGGCAVPGLCSTR
jgi:aspartate/methionine/tyrosine aminotransferase